MDAHRSGGGEGNGSGNRRLHGGSAAPPGAPARPDFTRILLVTLPEVTPVHEAAALKEDLRRAHIEPFARIINQSLLQCGSCDPLLQRRGQSEHRYICEVVEKHAPRTAWLPWQREEPLAADALAHLAAAALARKQASSRLRPADGAQVCATFTGQLSIFRRLRSAPEPVPRGLKQEPHLPGALTSRNC